MMSLIARAPSHVSSSTSVNPWKKSYGHQNPWNAKAEREERTGQPVVGSDPKTVPDYHHEQSTESSFSARYSKWDDNKAWSSQEWKTDTSMCERSGQLVVIPQSGARPEQFIIGNDETELELTVESRSFVNRVNDQVRKIRTNFKCYGKWRETFYDLVNVHDCNNGKGCIHGKELLEQLSIHCEHKRSHK